MAKEMGGKRSVCNLVSVDLQLFSRRVRSEGQGAAARIWKLCGCVPWTRNEPYYRWTSTWNNGKDLDFISYVTWTNNVASVNAYAYTVGTKVPLNYGDVDLFHRLDGNVAWQGPINMSKSGDTYTYDLDNIYDSNDVIHWMVRARRPGLSGYDVAFMIPKFTQPNSDPNATSYAYDYYKCTIGGTCTAIEMP